jgi:hypothetical protein
MKINVVRYIGEGVRLPCFVAVIVFLMSWSPVFVRAQVNSGSNGSDGAFNPATNTVIDMADHPNGIYQYTSVNISNGVTVTFIPNANNAPVVWLVQSNIVVSGTVDVSGKDGNSGVGGLGGPGGFRGGNAGTTATPGQGPGGGPVGTQGGNASYASLGLTNSGMPFAGALYGNPFLIPLVGGSGGGGALNSFGGSGGGGAILLAASGNIVVNGTILASYGVSCGGAGSGGAVRLIASRITGSWYARIWIGSGTMGGGCNSGIGGSGRVRFDTLDFNYGGLVDGVFTQGYQPIIIPVPGQGAQLVITSVGGVPVSASPTGGIATPDAVLSAQQNNPISIVVRCSNLPLNTPITVTVKPATGSSVNAVGYNVTGTQASSAVTVSLNMPHGGGIIYATVAN